jgi:hypothetical protein
MSLLAMQREFAHGWRPKIDDRRRAFIGDAADRPGVHVYQNNYRAQLVACLEDSFAQTRAWIGAEAFAMRDRRAYRSRPAEQLDARCLWRDFPETLGACSIPTIPKSANWPGSIARWAKPLSGRCGPVVTPADATHVDWDSARLILVPTMRVDVVTTNTPAIWSALAAGEMPPPALSLPDPGWLLVWRQDFVSCFRPIDAAERMALVRIVAGDSFGVLCAALVDAHGADEGIALASGILSRWIAAGLIAGLE